MDVASYWLTAIQRSLAHLIGDEGDAPRALARQFFLAWVASAVLMTVMTGAYLVAGLHLAAAVAALNAVLSVVALAWVARTGRLDAPVHLVLASATVAVVLTTLGQDGGVEPLGMLVVLPAVVASLLGARAGLAWLVICALTLSATWVAHHAGVRVGTPQPASSGGVFQLLFELFVASTFALFVHRLQHRSLTRARAAARARSDFLSSVSHELRTPLNGIDGMAEALRQVALAPEAREHLSHLEESSARLAELIDALLDVAQGDTPTTPTGPVDARALLERLAARHREAATTRGLSLRLSPSPTLPAWVLADEGSLFRALNQLVGNAVRYPAAGVVELGATWREGRLRLEVRDQGTGIPPGVLEVLQPSTDAFTRRAPGRGFGLGLLAASRLARRMGGELSLVSGPQGTCAAVEVPARESPAARHHPSPRAPVALVVDDNVINLKIAAALLERAGFSVLKAVNGAEAVTQAGTQQLSVVVMDLHMPVKDGLEATRELRAGSQAHVPIIGLTASSVPEEQAACLEAGMNCCLTKPLTPARLEEVLRHVGALPPTAGSKG
jgi:signal transduction histidine kinase